MEGWGEQSDLLVRLSASSSVTWPPKTTFLIASDGCAEGSEASSVGQSGKMQRLVEGIVRRKAKTGSATWPGRRGGDGVAGARPWPWGCGHASRSAVEVWELLTGAARSISCSSCPLALLLLPARTAPLPLSRRFVAFSL